MRNYRLVYKEKKLSFGQQCRIIRTGLAVSRKDLDRTCTMSPQNALNPLHQCFWVSCATIPAVGLSKIPSPFLSPQDARRYLLHAILQFSPHNLGCGAASTSLLVACNSSLTEIKLIFILPKSCTALSRTDLREVPYTLYLYSYLTFLGGA